MLEQSINKLPILSAISIPIFPNFLPILWQYINTTEQKSEVIIHSFYIFIMYIFIYNELKPKRKPFFL